MSLLNDEALVLYGTIKELENQGLNVDYLRRIGAGILERFGATEEELDQILNAIKAGAPYPLPVPEPGAEEPVPEEPPVEEPGEPIEEPIPEEPIPEEPAP